MFLLMPVSRPAKRVIFVLCGWERTSDGNRSAAWKGNIITGWHVWSRTNTLCRGRVTIPPALIRWMSTTTHATLNRVGRLVSRNILFHFLSILLVRSHQHFMHLFDTPMGVSPRLHIPKNQQRNMHNSKLQYIATGLPRHLVFPVIAASYSLAKQRIGIISAPSPMHSLQEEGSEAYFMLLQILSVWTTTGQWPYRPAPTIKTAIVCPLAVSEGKSEISDPNYLIHWLVGFAAGKIFEIGWLQYVMIFRHDRHLPAIPTT